MRKAELAEWILSLVTSTECAAAAVGDLLEENHTPGRFWFSIAYLALARVWRQMAAVPFRLLGIALYGLLVEIGCILCCCLLLMAVALIAVSVSRDVGLSSLDPWWLAVPVLYAVKDLVVPLQVGRRMARRYPEQGVAGALTLSALYAACTLAEWSVWEIARYNGADVHAAASIFKVPLVGFYTFDTVVWLSCASFTLALLAGAGYGRAIYIKRTAR